MVNLLSDLAVDNEKRSRISFSAEVNYDFLDLRNIVLQTIFTAPRHHVIHLVRRLIVARDEIFHRDIICKPTIRMDP